MKGALELKIIAGVFRMLNLCGSSRQSPRVQLPSKRESTLNQLTCFFSAFSFRSCHPLAQLPGVGRDEMSSSNFESGYVRIGGHLLGSLWEKWAGTSRQLKIFWRRCMIAASAQPREVWESKPRLILRFSSATSIFARRHHFSMPHRSPTGRMMFLF